MEFRDLKKQYEQNKEKIDNAIAEVVSGGHYIGGVAVAHLENRLAGYVGAKHCISCANGTDALQLALMAWQVGPEDAVFVPDFTFFSSGEVVPMVGAVPVFVDVEESTFNIDPQKLEAAVERVLHETDLVPKVVVAVDLFGHPAKHEAIRNIADKYHMYVLEDGAQGFGGMIGERKACSFGDISTTSFFPSKPLGCYGDGGAIFTDNDGWDRLLRSLVVHGKGADKYDNIHIGMNSRLDTLQAAVLNVKMDFFEEEIKGCAQAAVWYDTSLLSVCNIKCPGTLDGYHSSWAQYTILLENEAVRQQVIDNLKAAGIPTAVYYKKPMHMQAAFAGRQPVTADCPVTEDICKRCLSLPLSAYVTQMEVAEICQVISGVL